jgi:hypothetical protein
MSVIKGFFDFTGSGYGVEFSGSVIQGQHYVMPRSGSMAIVLYLPLKYPVML